MSDPLLDEINEIVALEAHSLRLRRSADAEAPIDEERFKRDALMP